MKHRDYVRAREARDPEFKAAREELRALYERKRALLQEAISRKQQQEGRPGSGVTKEPELA